jgi:myotubularin-related protein 5/13
VSADSNDASPTHSGDDESGFVDTNLASGRDFMPYTTKKGIAQSRDLGVQAVSFIGRFLDLIASDIGLYDDHVRQLHARLPAFVAAHIENLEQVHRESRRLPDTMKSQLLAPVLVAGERVLIGDLRVYLLPDGRQDMQTTNAVSLNKGGTEQPAFVDTTTGAMATTELACLLPAEGALYLTNYRVIFKGTPCDPFVCEQVVVRSVPLLAVTKAKRITPSSALLLVANTRSTLNTHQHMNNTKIARAFNTALQIRAATFQLMRVAFDTEVSEVRVDELLAQLDAMRYVNDVSELFAFVSSPNSQLVSYNLTANQHKSRTIT